MTQEKSLSGWKPVARDLLLITAAYVCCFAWVGANTDFPLNDDFSYARSVERLLFEGELVMDGWPAMTLVFQVLWGALFCLLFGFSYSALHVSTLVASLVGLASLYALTWRASADRRIACIATLCMATQPLFFDLSISFMTDVPFLSFALAATLCAVESLRRRSTSYVLWAALLSACATLIRQVGLAVPLSYLVVCWLEAWFTRSRSSRSQLVRWSLTPLFFTLAASVLTSKLVPTMPFFARPGDGTLLDILRSTDYATWKAFVVENLSAPSYIGLFLIPILWVTKPVPTTSAWPSRVVGLAFAGAPLSLMVRRRGALGMPEIGNVLYDFGLGPLTLRDTYFEGYPHYPSAPPALWWCVNVVSYLAFGVVVARIFAYAQHLLARLRSGHRPGGEVYAWWMSIGGGFLVSLPVCHSWFDRYLLPPLALTICALVASSKPFPFSWGRLIAAHAMLALMAGLAVTMTHDYLAYSRARWQATDELTKRHGIGPEQIDGGFEFNGRYLYRDDYEPPDNVSSWWVEDDVYRITSGPMEEDYQTERTHAFQRWLPPRREFIYTLRRKVP